MTENFCVVWRSSVAYGVHGPYSFETAKQVKAIVADDHPDAAVVKMTDVFAAPDKRS